MARPRICLATDSLDPSGVGRHMLDLAAGLREHADISVLADPGTWLPAAAAEQGLETGPVRPPALVAQWLREAGVDLVHVHAGIGWEGHDLARAAAAAQVPVLRTEHLPWLLTDPEQVEEYLQTLPLLSRVVAVGQDVGASFVEAGVPPERLVVIPNGVDAPPGHRAREEVRAELGAQGPLVLHIGRFAPQKRHDLLIEAFAELSRAYPTARLALVGEGPLQAAAVRRAEMLGISGRVLLLGRRADIGDLMAAADVLALPSDFEGLALTLLEAMAAGLPVVATTVTGIREAIDDTCAYPVPPGEPAALAAALTAALDDPQEARRRAQEAGRRQAREYARGRMQTDHLALYRTILQEENPVTRIGFVGAGGIARRHLGVLAPMEDVEIVAVTDVDRARAQELAGEHGAAVADDVDALIAEHRPDALVICVPPFAHGHPELAAARAGIPFLVEKPVALDLATAQEIRDAAKGLVTAVGYHWRYLDGLDRVREVTGDRPPRLASGFWLDSTPPVPWWGRQDQSGGQVVEQLTHLVDLARVLLGDARTVFALAEHTPRQAHPGLNVATSATASVLFAGGATAAFQCTCLLGWSHRVELQLYGEGYAVEITDRDVMIDVGAGRPRFGSERDPVEVQDRAFIDAVAGRENRIRCTYDDAVETLRTTLAIVESTRTGRAVDPEELS